MEHSKDLRGDVGERSGVFIPKGTMAEDVYLQFDVRLGQEGGSIYQQLVSDMVQDAAMLNLPVGRHSNTPEG